MPDFFPVVCIETPTLPNMVTIICDLNYLKAHNVRGEFSMSVYIYFVLLLFVRILARGLCEGNY